MQCSQLGIETLRCLWTCVKIYQTICIWVQHSWNSSWKWKKPWWRKMKSLLLRLGFWRWMINPLDFRFLVLFFVFFSDLMKRKQLKAIDWWNVITREVINFFMVVFVGLYNNLKVNIWKWSYNGGNVEFAALVLNIIEKVERWRNVECECESREYGSSKCICGKAWE